MNLKKVKISDLGEIVGGATPSTKNPEFFQGSIPWITPKDLADYNYRYISYGERSISQKALDSCSTRLLPQNSVLFSSRAPIGYVAIAKNELCTNQGFKSIIPNTEVVDPLFLYYLLKSSADHIASYGVGTTFKELSGKTFGQIELLIPESVPEQKKIAQVLGAFDDAIELNRSINDNLEAIAKQLYDYWFVQFDFPDEKGRPYKSSGGKMVWNDDLKRKIPEIFECCTLDEFIKLKDSQRVPLSNKERLNRKGIYPYYGATGIIDYVNNYIFDGDYLLLAEDGSTSDINGNPIVQYIWGKSWVNNHAHIVLPKTDGLILYTYQLLKNIPAKMIETGSIQKKISQVNLLTYKIVLPMHNLIKEYCQIVSPIWEQRKNNIEEMIALTKQRDKLLPLLMNGQATVNYHLSDNLA